MNQEHAAYLTKNFSFFKKDFNFECGDGWFELIKNLLEKLQALNIPNLCILQVKEKFGALVVYSDKELPHVRTLLFTACKASLVICEICGETGRLVIEQSMRYKTRCTKCQQL